VPYLFKGHRIRVSTNQEGEAWFVVADACAALAESPMAWAMANRRDEGTASIQRRVPAPVVSPWR
jgi:prophage antirepressor-like protein